MSLMKGRSSIKTKAKVYTSSCFSVIEHSSLTSSGVTLKSWVLHQTISWVQICRYHKKLYARRALGALWPTVECVSVIHLMLTYCTQNENNMWDVPINDIMGSFNLWLQEVKTAQMFRSMLSEPGRCCRGLNHVVELCFCRVQGLAESFKPVQGIWIQQVGLCTYCHNTILWGLALWLGLSYSATIQIFVFIHFVLYISNMCTTVYKCVLVISILLCRYTWVTGVLLCDSVC